MKKTNPKQSDMTEEEMKRYEEILTFCTENDLCCFEFHRRHRKKRRLQNGLRKV